MNEFDGLNLPQLLALLHDILRPAPVPWIPQTIGWAVLAAWFAAVVVIVGWNRYRRWTGNRYRREALATLRSIELTATDDPAALAGDIAALVKRTALAAFPRSTVASLYGDEWARFLRRSADDDPAVAAAADRLAGAAYRADADGRALVAPARRWIEVHRA